MLYPKSYSNDYNFLSSGMNVAESYTDRLWIFTYTNYVHEAIHAVAYLEEQVLPLPFCRGTERRPDQPGDTGDKKQRAQDDGCNLHSLNYSEGDGLPLEGRQMETEMDWETKTKMQRDSWLLDMMEERRVCFCWLVFLFFVFVNWVAVFIVSAANYLQRNEQKSAPFEESYEY